MTRSRFFAGLLAASMICMAAMSRAASFIDRSLDRFVAWMVSPFGKAGPRLSLYGGPTLVSGGGAAGISASLYNFNRHEAGVSKRSADRHT